MEDESPASPTGPPVVSKCLTEEMKQPEQMVFPLVSEAKLPPAEKWAQGIQEFRHENVVEEGKGVHKDIRNFLKSLSDD